MSKNRAELRKGWVAGIAVLVLLFAYFSYSGTTRNVAAALSERTGGDLFPRAMSQARVLAHAFGECREGKYTLGTNTPQDGYSNVYMESNSETRGNERPVLTNTVENMEGTEILEFENLPAYAYSQREIELNNQGQRIYGIAYIPDTENERVPLVICAHGLGGSYRSNAAYAEQLASRGLAAYCFGFRGGGGFRSDGDTAEMSVMTEVSDLAVIMDAASGRDFVDENRIVPLSYSDRVAASSNYIFIAFTN